MKQPSADERRNALQAAIDEATRQYETREIDGDIHAARVTNFHRLGPGRHDIGGNRFELGATPPPASDLLYLFSNNSSTPVTADRARQILATEAGDTPPVRARSRTRPWTRLNSAAQAEVARRYASGETSTSLADDFEVAKSTILRILRENNVVVRRQPLTVKQVATAKRLYESGLSLSAVAEQMSVNQETMRVAIIASGASLRPPTGTR